MWPDNFSTQTDLTWSDPTLSNPALPIYTSPYPSLVVLYIYTSALPLVSTTKFKFKFYSTMSPPKHIPHLVLSTVTAYPKSYLSIYNPSLSDPPPRLPFLNRYLHIQQTYMYISHLSKCSPSNHTYLVCPYLHYENHPSTPTMFQYLVL